LTYTSKKELKTLFGFDRVAAKTYLTNEYENSMLCANPQLEQKDTYDRWLKRYHITQDLALFQAEKIHAATTAFSRFAAKSFLMKNTAFDDLVTTVRTELSTLADVLSLNPQEARIVELLLTQFTEQVEKISQFTTEEGRYNSTLEEQKTFKKISTQPLLTLQKILDILEKLNYSETRAVVEDNDPIFFNPFNPELQEDIFEDNSAFFTPVSDTTFTFPLQAQIYPAQDEEFTEVTFLPDPKDFPTR
jgi:hypothetical protein